MSTLYQNTCNVLIEASYHDGDSDSAAFLAGQLWGSVNKSYNFDLVHPQIEHTNSMKYIASRSVFLISHAKKKE